MVQGKELSDAVTEGLRSVNLLADKAGDKLVSSYRSVWPMSNLEKFDLFTTLLAYPMPQ